VDEKLTGVDNLVLIGRLLGLGRRDARLRARELLADFQFEEAAARAVQTYSGGMRRRLELAASLVGRPRILFLDEPTTGLDPRARLQLWDLIRTLVADGVTVLLTTQYLDEADSLADDIVVIDHGKVIAAGTPEELKARVGSRTLIVRPRNARDIQAALGIAADVTGAEPEAQGQRISVPMSDTQALPVIVRRLDQGHIAIDELPVWTMCSCR
jgi:oleandomycin transport system ATP-binding protein